MGGLLHSSQQRKPAALVRHGGFFIPLSQPRPRLIGITVRVTPPRAVVELVHREGQNPSGMRRKS